MQSGGEGSTALPIRRWYPPSPSSLGTMLMYLPGVRRRLAGGHGLGSIAWQVGQSGPVHVCSRRPLVYGMAAVPSTDMTGEKDKRPATESTGIWPVRCRHRVRRWQRRNRAVAELGRPANTFDQPSCVARYVSRRPVGATMSVDYTSARRGDETGEPIEQTCLG